MLRNRLLALCALLVILGLPGLQAVAQGQGHGNGNGKSKHAQKSDDEDRDENPHAVATVNIRITPHEVETIRRYYHANNYSNLPPGLAKKNGNLPPGLQKHLERDGTLPPGLQKRLTPFPADLERQLPRLPDIYRRGTIDGSVVIIDRKTQRIIDIVHDILRP